MHNMASGRVSPIFLFYFIFFSIMLGPLFGPVMN